MVVWALAAPRAQPEEEVAVPDEDVYGLLAPAYEMLASSGRIAKEIDSLEISLRAVGAVRILDAGCAAGFHSIELSRRGFHPTGIDLSRAMIREARARAAADGRPIRFTVKDLKEAHRATGGPFDAVLCLGNTMASIHTAADRRRVFRSFHSTLRPGGLLTLQLRDLSSIPKTGFAFPTRSLQRGSEEWILLRRQESIGGRIRFTSTLLYRPHAKSPWETRTSTSLVEVVPVSDWRSDLTGTGFSRIRLATDLRGTPRRGRGAADLVIFARKV
jgi:SAM-dependent methyltransferase